MNSAFWHTAAQGYPAGVAVGASVETSVGVGVGESLLWIGLPPA